MPLIAKSLKQQGVNFAWLDLKTKQILKDAFERHDRWLRSSLKDLVNEIATVSSGQW